jgi:cell division protein FtsA
MGAKTHKAYTIINKSAVFYSLDNGKRVIDPIGKVSSQLSAKMCYCLAENNFLDYIDGILSDIGIKRATYISANLAEILYMLDPSLRDRYAILVDIGYITTSVMVAHGDGLLALYSFSLGGGHITGDLYEVLKIPFSQAEMLKHKIVLGWNATENDTYEVMGKEFISTYSAKATNEIAEARLEIIAEYINRCLDKCPYEFPDYLPVYITGGGVCYIKGAKDFLAKKLGRKVEFISPRLSQYDRPDYSSEIAMLDVAIEQTEYGYNLIY